MLAMSGHAMLAMSGGAPRCSRDCAIRELHCTLEEVIKVL